MGLIQRPRQCAFVWRRKDKLRHWNTLLSQAPNTRARLVAGNTGAGSIHAQGPLTIRAAHTQLLEPTTEGPWLAVGDAAASFDPLTSLGIGFALHSAATPRERSPPR